MAAAARLDTFSTPHEPMLSVLQVAHAFGVPPAFVDTWHDAGWLPIRAGRIAPADVARFVRGHGELVDLTRVPPAFATLLRAADEPAPRRRPRPRPLPIRTLPAPAPRPIPLAPAAALARRAVTRDGQAEPSPAELRAELREWLRWTPRRQRAARFTLAGRTVTRGALSAAIDRLYVRQRRIVQLHIEQRLDRLRTCVALNSISMKTLERDSIAALDTLAAFVLEQGTPEPPDAA